MARYNFESEPEESYGDPVAARPSISQAAEKLEKQLMRSTELVAILEKHLSPVLAPSEPSPEKFSGEQDVTPGRPTSSHLAHLNRLDDLASGFAARLSRLMDRIEV